MKVIPPITVTAAMLTSSTIAEPDTSIGEASWVSATNYTTGALVIRTTTHKVYERLAPGGVDAGLPEVSPTKWLEIGPTNKWAMFDSNRTTGSSASGTCVVVITPSASVNTRINSIALVGCSALSVTIDVSSGGSSVYTYTAPLLTRNTSGWYKYFFGTFNYRASVVNFNIPPTIDNIITITFTMPATNGSIGNIIIGNYISLGDIQVSPTLEALNFSKIERDEFGNSLLVQRRTVPRTSQRTFTTKANVNKLLAARESLNAVPAVWAGIDDNIDLYFEPLLILGVYKEFSISMDYPDYAIVSLQLEEM